MKSLTGFKEESPEQVRKNMSCDGKLLKLHINGKKFICVFFEIPSLAELREKVASIEIPLRKISIREKTADIQQLHVNTLNANSLFQVASQFNLLEMVQPDITPGHGIGRYESDRTQGLLAL